MSIVPRLRNPELGKGKNMSWDQWWETKQRKYGTEILPGFTDYAKEF